MNYTINVARKSGGYHVHYFRVSIDVPKVTDAVCIALDLSKRFPAPEFKIDLTSWQTIGCEVPLTGVFAHSADPHMTPKYTCHKCRHQQNEKKDCEVCGADAELYVYV